MFAILNQLSLGLVKKIPFFSIIAAVFFLSSFSYPKIVSKDPIHIYLDSAENAFVRSYPLSVAYCEKALTLAQNDESKAQCFIHLSKTHIRGLNIQAALWPLQAAFKLENKLSDTSKIQLYNAMGIYYSGQSHYEEAEAYMKKALALAIKGGHYNLQADLYNSFGVLYGIISSYSQETDAYEKELVIHEKMRNWSDLSLCLRNLTLTYMSHRKFDKARLLINRAITLNQSRKNNYELSACIFIQGKLEFELGNHIGALNQYHLALPLLEKYNERRKVNECWVRIAGLYTVISKLDSAEMYFNKAISESQYIERKAKSAFHFQYGRFLNKKGKIKEALANLNESLDWAKKQKSKTAILNTDLYLSAIYDSLGQKSKSLVHLQEAYKYRDSLSMEENKSSLAEAQFKYDFEKKEREIQDLKLKESHAFGSIMMIIFIASLTIVLLFLGQKSEHQKLLLQKNLEIQKQNRRLEESNEILKEFAYISAHDLREPMRNISSFTNIISKRYYHLLPAESGDYINFINIGVKRMETLLSALLEYSTIITDNNETTESISITKAIQEAESTFQDIIAEKKAKIRYPSVLPHIYVNQKHLRILLENIIHNALKFNENQPTIHIDYVLEKQDFILSITDNGIGIKQEYGKKVFRIFQRLTRTAYSECSGIGLPICKNIVEKYEGSIWFDKHEQGGTTFFISFPIERCSLKENKVSAKKQQLAYTI
jgi:signal transduction histidine kinase